jgi:hypothetical protein
LALWQGHDSFLIFSFANSISQGLSFIIDLFVVNFIMSNSIRQRFRAGRFSNTATSPSPGCPQQFVQNQL